MYSRLVTCVVLIAGCALLAIPVSLPAYGDSSGQKLGNFTVPTQPAVSPADVYPPTVDAPLIGDRADLTEVLWRTAGTGTKGSRLGVPQPPSKCIPFGGLCHGRTAHCCPAPRGHHSYCSNPSGWGTCTES
jgi:hypothetical protein